MRFTSLLCPEQSTTTFPLLNSGVPFKKQLIVFRHAVFCVLWNPVQMLLNNYFNCAHGYSVQSRDEFSKAVFVDCVL